MAEEKVSMRKLSKEGFTSSDGATKDAIKTGSLQRIADAVEKMSVNFLELQSELKFWKATAEDRKAENQKLRGTIAALKAWATRNRRKSA